MAKHALGFAVIAAIAVIAVALAPVSMDDADADPAPDLSIYRYTPKLTVTSENFAAVKYIVWDFGDGTVLDGRWQYYIDLQDAGEQLSADIIAGINAYKALLAQNGGSLFVTTHTYSSTGTFTATVVAMNPLGYVHGTSEPYDGVLNQDDTGYNGGMESAQSIDITSPSDSTLDSAAFKAIAGTWDRVEYVVEIKGYPIITFDTMGGSAIAPLAVQNTYEYTAASMPANPTKDGSTFNGWYTDSACTQPYDWSQKVTSPMTLYAGWTAADEPQYDHIITYKDGTSTIGTQNTRNGVNGNVSVTISQNNPTKAGQTFAGWVANDGDTPVFKGATVTVPVSGLTLNATWNAPTTTYYHRIHYEANGGSGTMQDTEVTDNVQGGTPMILAGNVFTFTGHTFAGWKVGNTIYQPGAQMQVQGNSTMTAIAQWAEDGTPVTKVTVRVDGATMQFNVGSTVADIPIPSQTGYTFEGWYSSADHQSKYASATVLTDNMSLYSKMVQNDPAHEVKITVKVDGKDVKVDAGKTVADLEKPSKRHHVFDGWYSDEALTQKVAESVVLTEGMTLFSKLVEDPDSPNDWLDYLPYAIIAVGGVIAIIGLLVHPIVLVGGAAIVAVGVLQLLKFITLF